MSDLKEDQSIWRQVLSKKMGICLILGFVSGLPLYVLLTLMTAFARESGLDLSVIGVLSVVTFPYTWKFVWSPLVDRFNLLRLGRRRGWMLVTQIVLIFAIALTGFVDVKNDLWLLVFFCFLTSFASATQDIVIDAYRREILSDEELGLGNSFHVNAYRLAGLIPGGLSFILAYYLPWNAVFVITALFMFPGLILSIFLKEPANISRPRNLKAAIVEPFTEFITRKGYKYALLVVAFIFFYKLGDSMATALSTPFYLDLKYDLITIGVVAKNAGLWSMVIGSFLGGLLMLKIGINKALWIFGFGQLITILGFAYLAHLGQYGTPSVWVLALVISAEYLGVGLGTAAFVSFIARETNPKYTATQIALFTSFSAIPRTFCNATTGFLIEELGYENFFYLCTALAVPGMLLLFKVAPYFEKSEARN